MRGKTTNRTNEHELRGKQPDSPTKKPPPAGRGFLLNFPDFPKSDGFKDFRSQ
jgi:hypothetical protein